MLIFRFVVDDLFHADDRNIAIESNAIELHAPLLMFQVSKTLRTAYVIPSSNLSFFVGGYLGGRCEDKKS